MPTTANGSVLTDQTPIITVRYRRGSFIDDTTIEPTTPPMP